ncbi:MAG: hypothetical protein ABIR47_00765 [Candidatus Kapaibacterium sp.]
MDLIIVSALLLILLVWTITRLPGENDLGRDTEAKSKLRESLILDVRAANQYCMAFIALLGVITTIIIANKKDLAPMLNLLPIWPFTVGFMAAAISLLFIPAGYGHGSFRVIQAIWLRTMICEQIVVVATCHGIWRIAMIALA